MADHLYTNADLKDLPGFDRMVGPKPPDWFESNGVSCGPDIIFGVDLRPSSHWHDWRYHVGGTEKTRYIDDLNFRTNCKTCGLTSAAGNRLNKTMFYRLRLWGHKNYTYDKGQEPKRTWMFWTKLFFGRYIAILLLVAILAMPAQAEVGVRIGGGVGVSVGRGCAVGSCGVGGLVPLPRRPQRPRSVAAPIMIVRIESTFEDRTAHTTGTLLKGGYVVTCAHGLRTGWSPTVIFHDGQRVDPVSVKVDEGNDFAVLRISTTDASRYRAMSVSPPPAIGTSVVLSGFGGGSYSAVNGAVERYENDWIVIRSTGVREGDSGGPIYLPGGGLVGLIAEETIIQGVHRVKGVGILRILAVIDVMHAAATVATDPVTQQPTEAWNPTKPTAAANAVNDSPQQPSDLATQPTQPTDRKVPADVQADGGGGSGSTTTGDQSSDGDNHMADSSGGIVDAVKDSLASPSITTAVLLALGICGPLGIGIGIGVPVAYRALRRRRARRVAVATQQAEGHSESGGPFLGNRDTKEAKQFLQLSDLEGRSGVLDALNGRATLDWIRDTIESSTADNETKGFAQRLGTYLQQITEKMAPLAIQK